MNETHPPVALRALDVEPPAKQTGYPEPYASRVAGRLKRRLGDAFGLEHFGVNLTRLAPGSVSALRHAHVVQDEFIYILEGTPTLVTDAGPTVLAPGMCAGFRGGRGDAHHLRNDSGADVWYLEVGDRLPGDGATYPDDDIAARAEGDRYIFTRKDGSAF